MLKKRCSIDFALTYKLPLVPHPFDAAIPERRTYRKVKCAVLGCNEDRSRTLQIMERHADGALRSRTKSVSMCEAHSARLFELFLGVLEEPTRIIRN